MKAKDRYGNEYEVGETVMPIELTAKQWPSQHGKEQVILEIKEVDYGESGFNISLKNKATGMVWKSKDGSIKFIDTNWIRKIEKKNASPVQ